MSNAKDVQMPQNTFFLGGKDRVIKFDMNSFAELEKRFGSVDKAMEALQDGKVATFRLLLWYGLIHNEAEVDADTGDVIRYKITPYEVGSWIDSTTMKEMSTALMTALVGSLPEKSKEEIDAAIRKAEREAEQKVLATINGTEKLAVGEAVEKND